MTERRENAGMFSFLSQLVPKRRDRFADVDVSDDDEREPSGFAAPAFVPPAPLAEADVAPAHLLEATATVADAPVADAPATDAPDAHAPDAHAPVDTAPSAPTEDERIEAELREQQRLAEQRLAERQERDRLAEEAHREEVRRRDEEREEALRAHEASRAAEEALRRAEASEREAAALVDAHVAAHAAAPAVETEPDPVPEIEWKTEREIDDAVDATDRDDAHHLESERVESERVESERAEAERAEAEREEWRLAREAAVVPAPAATEAPAPVAGSFTWPATLLHHEVAGSYGVAVRRTLLTMIVELQDPKLAIVLIDALFEESPGELRPDVLGALRRTYHGEWLRETYERFARIGCDRERDVAREALLALDSARG